MREKYNIFLTDHARTDLAEIYDYITSDNTNKARLFITELEKKVYSLNEFPERNPLIPENEFFDTDYRHLLHKKYRVVYRIENNDIYILRIFHGKKLFAP